MANTDPDQSSTNKQTQRSNGGATSGGSAVLYPETLDSTTSMSSVNSQMSSFASLSLLSQPHLASATGWSEHQQVRRNDISTDTTSSVETDSEWDDPPSTESDLIERKESSSEENMNEKANKIISSVVWNRSSIMFGPVNDSGDEESDEDEDSSDDDTSNDDSQCGSRHSEVLLDQSTLTTSTTSYTTLISAIEEPKEADQDTTVVADGTVVSTLPSFREGSKVNAEKLLIMGSCNDKPEEPEPPISSTLSDALEEMEGITGDEEESTGNDYLRKPQTIDDADYRRNEVQLSNAAADATSTQLLFQSNREGLTKPSAANGWNPDVQTEIGGFPVAQMKTNSSDNQPSLNNADKCAVPQAHTEDSLQTDSVSKSSSSGESKSDLLTSSEIILDTCSSDELLVGLESQLSLLHQESTSTDKLWKLPDGASIEEQLAFLLEKVSLLQHRQSIILQKLQKEQQTRVNEMTSYQTKLDFIIKKFNENEVEKRDEKMRQEKRIKLIENAVIELSKPVLSARNQASSKKSSVSYQKAEKLKNFFGSEPPLLQQFLKDLGYEEYMSRFENEKIGLQELPHLQEEDFINLSIPLGPRLRIMHEAKLL